MSLALSIAGLFFLCVALVLRWSESRLAELRRDEAYLSDQLADESPWKPEMKSEPFHDVFRRGVEKRQA